jgi:hypothetical protein
MQKLAHYWATDYNWRKVEAEGAAEFWIGLVNSESAPLVDGFPNWRHITVAAASNRAKSRPRAHDLEQ